MTSSGQPGGRGYFPSNRIQKTGCCKAQTSLGVPFKSVALKIAERSESELLDFLGSLIRVSIRLGVLIWLHNLIPLHNQNVTLLRSCGYIWRGLEDFLASAPRPWGDTGALLKGRESLLGERISPAWQLSGWASPGVGRSRRCWRRRTTLGPQVPRARGKWCVKTIGLWLTFAIKSRSTGRAHDSWTALFPKETEQLRRQYLSSRKVLCSTISIPVTSANTFSTLCERALLEEGRLMLDPLGAYLPSHGQYSNDSPWEKSFQGKSHF